MKIRRLILVVLASACLILVTSIQNQAWAQSGDVSWIEAGSEHFVVLTDTDEEKAVRLLRDLESRYVAFSDTIFPVEPREFRIKVILFDVRTDFESVLPDSVKTGIDLTDTPIPERSAYLFQGITDVFIVARDRPVDELIDDVGHSLGHLLLSRSVMWQPFWLLEPSGEFVRLSGRDDGDDGVDPEEAYPLEDLITIVASEEFDDLGDGGAFRRQSYNLLRILLRDHRNVLDSYINDLREANGYDAEQVLEPLVFEALEKETLDYRDPGPGLRELEFEPSLGEVSPAESDTIVGDLVAGTGQVNRARAYYQASRSDEARLGLAILGNRGADQAGARRGFQQLITELPDSGLAHYYFGMLGADTDAERRSQIEALERAIELMPLMGRAYAELGFLYVEDGRPEDAIRVAERGVGLEPEFADRAFEVMALAWFELGDDDLTREFAESAATLPHKDPSTLEHYRLLVPDVYRRLEGRRREQEALRVDELRREVQALVDEVDPRPLPTTGGRLPVGLVHYEVTSPPQSGVQEPSLVSGQLPDYSAQLRRQRVQGTVVLDIDLDRQGRGVEIEVRESSDAGLSQVAIAALRRWRFDPARKNDESVPFSFQLTFTFDLQE
jgi:TonB family protein